MKIAFLMERADLRVGMKHASALVAGAAPPKAAELVVNMIVWGCGGFLVMLLMEAFDHSGVWVAYASALVVLMVAAVWGFAHYRSKRFVRALIDLYGPFPVRQSVELSDAGLDLESHTVCAHYPWPTVRTVTDTPSHLVFLLHPASAIAIPRSAFDSEDERQRFSSFARDSILTKERGP